PPILRIAEPRELIESKPTLNESHFCTPIAIIYTVHRPRCAVRLSYRVQHCGAGGSGLCRSSGGLFREIQGGHAVPISGEIGVLLDGRTKGRLKGRCQDRGDDAEDEGIGRRWLITH